MHKPNWNLLDRFPWLKSDYEVVDVREVNTVTLDNLIGASDLNRIDFLNIDTQGSEMEIFKGGGRTLKDVLCIEAELHLKPLYKGQSLYYEIESYLREQGFEVYDIDSFRWTHKAEGRGYSNAETRMLSHPRKFLDGELVQVHPLYFRSKIKSKKAAAKSILLALAFGKKGLAQILKEKYLG